MSTVFHNADVITMDATRPRAQAVLVDDRRIVSVGSDAEVFALKGGGASLVDCRGGALLPAFIDAHCHLLSYAAYLLSLDCSPSAVSSIADIQRALRLRAAGTPPGRWIRAVGYDETELAERRHPTRRDLDAAAADHPVRLIHRTGHASVLNSLALSLAGVDTATAEPPGGYLDRDLATGEPSGLLVEMNEIIDAAVPALAYDELAAGVRQANDVLLSQGVTAVQDATAANGPAEWDTFQRLIEDGCLDVAVTLMEGLPSLGRLPEEALSGRLRRGPVKIAVKELGDAIEPDEERLAALVWQAHSLGRQVAIHAVDKRAVAAAVAAIQAALRGRPRPDHRHRIEHCGICPPELAARIAVSGVAVVTQPSFLYFSGERYLAQLSDLADLYPLRRLHRAGVRLAAGSDAPIVPPRPLLGIQSAVARLSQGGSRLNRDEALDVGEALRLHTDSAAWVAFQEAERGSIASGKIADIVLLSSDPATVPADEIADLEIEMTVVRGRVVWPPRTRESS